MKLSSMLNFNIIRKTSGLVLNYLASALVCILAVLLIRSILNSIILQIPSGVILNFKQLTTLLVNNMTSLDLKFASLTSFSFNDIVYFMYIYIEHYILDMDEMMCEDTIDPNFPKENPHIFLSNRSDSTDSGSEGSQGSSYNMEVTHEPGAIPGT